MGKPEDPRMVKIARQIWAMETERKRTVMNKIAKKVMPEDQMKIVKEHATKYQNFQKKLQNASSELHKMEKGKISSTDEEKKDAKKRVKELEKERLKLLAETDEILKPCLEYIDIHTHLEADPELQKCFFGALVMVHLETKKFATSCIDHPERLDALYAIIDNPTLVKEFIVHGCPQDNNFVKACFIWKQLSPILEKDEDRSTPEGEEMYLCHRRLAMAISLQAAGGGFAIFDRKDKTCPIARYKHYVKAHREGELDPAFSYFSVWEYRFVVDSDASNEELQWARDYLKRYRPDQAIMPNMAWRYAQSVRTDVGYRKPNWVANPRTYAQLISGGGQCGPRAWHGRMMKKAFGLPTWGVRQPGHAAAGVWTPTGWETILGAGWQYSYWGKVDGQEFVEEANARAFIQDSIKEQEYSLDIDEYYKKVALPMCFAAVAEEKTGEWFKPNQWERKYRADFIWHSLSFLQRRTFAAQCDKKTMFQRKPKDGQKPVVETQIEKHLQRKDNPMKDNEVTVEDGVITIPSCAFLKKHKGVDLVRSFEGGSQAHMGGDKAQYVEYDFPDYATPEEGREYNLQVKVCNVHLQQVPLKITVSTNKENKVESKVPYTVGDWGLTESVCIGTLEPGSLIKFTREGSPMFGLTIKALILTPK